MDEPVRSHVRGTVHLLILRTLRGGRRLHGYRIASELQERTDGFVELEDGALYQALHRMHERGWLASAWGHAQSGKRARFYWLTPAGERRLKKEAREWRRWVRAMSAVMGTGRG